MIHLRKIILIKKKLHKYFCLVFYVTREKILSQPVSRDSYIKYQKRGRRTQKGRDERVELIPADSRNLINAILQ